ncbi:leucine-rich repeat domain-containing protein [Gimesia sp.]|uniref:leucine-rich repeat domain-containing protein n=1 Tax=Gimesia sp. TaxID=2024833 RepID=UPI003A8F98C0
MNYEPPLPDAASQMLARFGSQIEYTANEPKGLINLTHAEVANEDLRHLIFYPGFDALILDYTNISDAGLSFIGEMSNLERVGLYDALVSDTGLKSLLKLSKLEKLNIACAPGCFPPGLRPVPAANVRRNQITDRGLGYLTELTSLRSLDLQATRVTDTGLSRYLPELSRLQKLSLAFLDITDASLLALESLAWLESINLSHTAISNDAIVDLVIGKAFSLRRLNLSNTVVNDQALAECLPGSQLKKLELIDTGITDAACQECVECSWLTDLHLDFTDITDDGVRHLANCEHLRSLGLFKTKVTDTSLVWLSDSGIEDLGLGYTSITDAGIPALIEFPALESLDLQGTSLTDKGLRFLSSATNLKELRLENTEISNAGIEFLLPLSLETLSLNPRIDNVGLSTLALHNSLQHLAIWNCNVTNWQPLTKLERLEVLLIDDSITDLSPLRELDQLKFLLLCGNHFSPMALARLRLALPQCQIRMFPSCACALGEFWCLC